MALLPQQDLVYAGGEDFTDALDDIGGSTSDEGIEVVAHTSAIAVSSLVPPEESNIRVPPPGSSAKHFQLVSDLLRWRLFRLLT